MSGSLPPSCLNVSGLSSSNLSQEFAIDCTVSSGVEREIFNQDTDQKCILMKSQLEGLTVDSFINAGGQVIQPVFVGNLLCAIC